MKDKNNNYFLAVILLLIIILLIPNNTVWGGYSFQTVPTIGPSPTPTNTTIASTTQPTRTATQVQPSATNTQMIGSTATAIIGIIIESTSTPQSTDVQPTEGLTPTETIESLVTEEQSELSTLVTPIATTEGSSQEEQTDQADDNTIPGFVFPLVVVLLLVIIYLVTRLSMKQSGNDNHARKQ